MASGEEPGHIHPERTRASEYQYFFYDKHHGRGGPRTSQWAEDLDEPEEFGIFDRADENGLSDEDGHLYGLRIRSDEILTLGTLGQQVAKFPWTRPGQPWHGFPLGPLRNPRQPHPPVRPLPREALRKMEERGILDAIQRRRLERGKQV